MAVERVSGGSSLIDVLDRVLDKGIVIDAWVRISLVGIDLITVEARIVVASIDTYLKYADAVGLTGLVSRPQLGPAEEEEITTVETTRRRRPVRTRRPAARLGELTPGVVAMASPQMRMRSETPGRDEKAPSGASPAWRRAQRGDLSRPAGRDRCAWAIRARWSPGSTSRPPKSFPWPR